MPRLPRGFSPPDPDDLELPEVIVEALEKKSPRLMVQWLAIEIGFVRVHKDGDDDWCTHVGPSPEEKTHTIMHDPDLMNALRRQVIAILQTQAIAQKGAETN